MQDDYRTDSDKRSWRQIRIKNYAVVVWDLCPETTTNQYYDKYVTLLVANGKRIWITAHEDRSVEHLAFVLGTMPPCIYADWLEENVRDVPDTLLSILRSQT